MKRLIGQTILKIEGLSVGSEEVMFFCKSGDAFKMYHEQGCFESVRVEDVCGNPEHLIGLEILESEELSNQKDPENYKKSDESYTFTFYRIATNRGAVVIRWLGESNGWYGEEVEFIQTEWGH